MYNEVGTQEAATPLPSEEGAPSSTPGPLCRKPSDQLLPPSRSFFSFLVVLRSTPCRISSLVTNSELSNPSPTRSRVPKKNGRRLLQYLCQAALPAEVKLYKNLQRTPQVRTHWYWPWCL